MKIIFIALSLTLMILIAPRLHPQYLHEEKSGQVFKYYIITVIKMKNATVALSVLFQLIFNREWMITALLQAKYLDSINE